MDPISLIIAALAAGVSQTASEAVKDAYAGVKALIRRRFGGDKGVEAALDRLEQRPAAGNSELAQHLRVAGADRDRELILAAQGVLRLVDPAGSEAGKYDVRITGGKGIVVGDNASVTMNFNNGD
jgi:hypothetical protein